MNRQQLTVAARRELAAIGFHERAARSHWKTLGDVCIAAKARLRHGDFGGWLKDVGLTERSAQQYMQVARNWLLIQSEAKRVSHFSLRDALRLIQHVNYRRREHAVMARMRTLPLSARCEIRHAPMSVLLPTLSNVNAIIVDPPYNRNYLPLYEELARLSAPALKRDGTLVVMTSQSILPDVIRVMTATLPYRWTCAYCIDRGQDRVMWQAKMHTFWKPVLIFGSVKRCGRDVFTPVYESEDKDFHPWGQNLVGMTQIVERFSRAGDLVVDPMVGGGSCAVAAVQTGRRFIGGDADIVAVDTSRRRVAEWLESEDAVAATA